MSSQGTARALEPPVKTGYRRDIEGLRGIAVTMVVAFHCMLRGFTGGFTGVDLFFVLSGYLITGLLVNEFEKTSHISLGRFYSRRIRRLLPAAALATCGTIVIGIFVLAPQELADVGHAARETAVYLSNMFFARQASDYFGADVALNPLLHMWSLAVEEQFYLFWPLLIFLGLKYGRSRKSLAAVLGAMALLSFAACVRLTEHHVNFSFYGLPTRAWEFAVGGLAAMLPAGLFKRWQLSILGIVGLAGVAWSCVYLSGWDGFPGWIAAIPVVATVACLIAGTGQAWRGVSAITEFKPLLWLGRLSYSWYLWHWPALVVANAVVPQIGIKGRLVAALISLGIAALSYRFVENPIRFHPALVKRPAACFALAGAVTAMTIFLGTVCLRLSTAQDQTSEMASITKAMTDIADMPRSQCVSQGGSPDVKTCVFGDAASTTKVVLFGDSHSIQWFDALDGASKSHDWRLVTFVKSHCPSASVDVPDLPFVAARNCAAWRERSIQKIIRLRPAVVVMSNAAVYLDGGDRGDKPRITHASWRDGTRHTLEMFSAAHIPVVLIRDVRFSRLDIPICVARARAHHWYSEQSCQLNANNPTNLEMFAADKAAVSGLSGVKYIDFTDDLCHGGTCPVVKDGQLVYRDDNHLTGTFAGTLAGELARQVSLMLPQS
ncbi:MAG: acyltransferase family protein [Terriglobales bacterium]